MQNTIDFRELRRRERQRIRSSNKDNATSVGGAVDGNCVSASDEQELRPAHHHQSIRGNGSSQEPSASDSSSDDAFVSLLPQNQLSEDAHRVGPSTIDSVFYAQRFLTPAQAKEVMSWLESVPDFAHITNGTGTRRSEREESIQHNGKWTTLKHARRRVALFDGTICKLPLLLQRLSNTLVAVGAFPASQPPPNHVLINEYQPGEGIMPHTDGPAYESRTATISLGGTDAIFKLWPRHRDDNNAEQPITKRPSLEVVLHGHGSLVVFTNDAYLNFCHEISEGILEETTSSGELVTRGYRVSLTFRTKK